MPWCARRCRPYRAMSPPAKEESFVFAKSTGEGLKSISNGFEGAVRRCKLGKHIRFHDLRHTFASHLVMKGVDLRTVAKLMGHRDIRVTMRYAHLAPDHLQAAVDVLTMDRGLEGGKKTG